MDNWPRQRPQFHRDLVSPIAKKKRKGSLYTSVTHLILSVLRHVVGLLVFLWTGTSSSDALPAVRYNVRVKLVFYVIKHVCLRYKKPETLHGIRIKNHTSSHKAYTDFTLARLHCAKGIDYRTLPIWIVILLVTTHKT
jgi:hypothetical protein